MKYLILLVGLVSVGCANSPAVDKPREDYCRQVCRDQNMRLFEASSERCECIEDNRLELRSNRFDR